MLNKKSRRSLNDTMPPPPPPPADPVNKTKTFSLFKLSTVNSAINAIGNCQFAKCARIIFIEPTSSHSANTSAVQTAPTIVELDSESDDALTVLSLKDASLLQHLNYLQRIYNQIDDIKNVRNDAPVVRRIFTIATEFITLLYAYAQQLDYGQNRKYDASIEYKQLSQAISNGTAFNRISNRLSCLDDKPCISGEKLVFERRLLAALSLICSRCPSITITLLDSALDLNEVDVNMEKYVGHVKFVDSLAIALTNIGFLVFYAFQKKNVIRYQLTRLVIYLFR